MVFVFFVVGLVCGSFFNVLIWRIPRRESIIFPTSHCPGCRHPLSPRELIPVVSYVLQRGRCRHCGQRISWQYPLIELITAAGFVFYATREPAWPALVARLLLFSLLLVAGAIDLRHQRLPNVITIPGAVLGVVLAMLGWTIPFWSSLLGMLVSGGLLLAIALMTNGMGMGDVKLAALIGAFIGPWPALGSIFIASASGALIGLVYLFVTKQGRKTPIPFGPFLALGALLGSELFM